MGSLGHTSEGVCASATCVLALVELRSSVWGAGLSIFGAGPCTEASYLISGIRSFGLAIPLPPRGFLRWEARELLLREQLLWEVDEKEGEKRRKLNEGLAVLAELKAPHHCSKLNMLRQSKPTAET